MSSNSLALTTNDVRSLFSQPKVINGIKAIIPKYMSHEKMLRICVNAVSKNPQLAECSQSSLLSSVMISAALGLEPNTIAGHAFLIPYKKGAYVNKQWVSKWECQFQMGYKGYLELASRNENCVSFVGLPVFSNDKFRHYVDQGTGELTLEYEAARRARGELDGAFSLAVWQRSTGARGRTGMWLPLEDIEKARSRSPTYMNLVRALESAEDDGNQDKIKKARARLAETPWVAFTAPMAAKTSIIAMAKQLPIFGTMAAASNIEDRSEDQTIDVEALSENPMLIKAVIDGDEDLPTISQNNAGSQDGNEISEDTKAITVVTKPLNDRAAKNELAEIAESYGVTLDKRKPLDVLTAEVDNLRNASKNNQVRHNKPAHDIETGEVMDNDGFNFGG